MTKFQDLNVCKKTLQGLEKHSFITMTDVQEATIPIALSGKDVLGAAKTGSGKTLCFLIPILETLYNNQWTSYDGLGALVISPTRELALQIFGELRKVGAFHSFSAGLLIGGKDVKQEQDRVGRMNILIATPGRLLQHLDQTPEFDVNSLKILVLDEADRILDQGFEKTINSIVEHLPKDRQTLLFSATQTKSVKDLARLSLQDPEYISVHESLPSKLSQKYTIVPLEKKLDVLFSFLKSHLKSKIIVFLSSCKQVRFVYEVFCKLQPGIPLMCLFGRQKQQKRMGIYQQFLRKTEACLFATDIAARGLDFPSVDWVIQVDCPEDVATYIHRVGRTARYDAAGQALLMLTESEKAMIDELEKKVEISEIKINPNKQVSIQTKLMSLLSSSPDLKYLAQKSFICYVKSIYLQKNKSVFNVESIPLDAYAESLGLIGAPQIKILSKTKNENRQLLKADDKDIDQYISEEENEKPENKQITRVDKMFAKKNNTILSEHYRKMVKSDSDTDNDDLFDLKRQDHDLDESIPAIVPKKISKKNLVKKVRGKKTVFDEQGNEYDPFSLETFDQYLASNPDAQKEAFMSELKQEMSTVDQQDKLMEKLKKQERKREKKEKLKRKQRQEDGGATLITEDGGATLDDFETESDYSDASLKEEKSTKKQKLDQLSRQQLQDLALGLLDKD